MCPQTSSFHIVNFSFWSSNSIVTPAYGGIHVQVDALLYALFTYPGLAKQVTQSVKQIMNSWLS
jgi:hypothetical protein